ncbi:putative DNA helicase ino80 [Turnera subulata]|uniref:Chromatin-remodeling ATPase INO80 n=1 Tax=Turnera subulata TaxID=218843 RepID=A0A9Q0F5S3_9ROSI|nr:putative DNA helicase ino80 [Turnera subulata]
MEQRRQAAKDSLSYSNLFNLESLMNFKVPQPDDEFDYYGSSSQDESRGSQAAQLPATSRTYVYGGAMTNYSNGAMPERELSMVRRKRKLNSSDGEEEDGYYGTHITEEKYRSMLGEHIRMYKRRFKDSPSTPAPVRPRAGIPTPKSSLGATKTRKFGNEQRGGLYNTETASEWLNGSTPQKRIDYNEPDSMPKTFYEPPYLDIGDGITYRIPPSYDKLAASLNLPSFSDIQVDEFYLKGTLDLGSLDAMIANDQRFGPRSQQGMAEPRQKYESLQARLKELAASNSAQKFSLKISDAELDSIPEGAAGNIQRSIWSDGVGLQVYYVKVLEKGDTYEIIERSIPKKPKVIKDPSVIEREEMERIGKVWVNIVRRDIPKHHRIFTTFHRKQLIDAKRFSESCQREVKLKVSRSLKLMRGATIRTRKLARDMLLFWKRIDKEMAEVRKREEREAAEALKREQELREAKRQQQRLNFLIQQTELYSHFMQNKTNSQPLEALPREVDKEDYQDMQVSTSEAGVGEDEDPEEAELRKEALRAAQDAVSKQKKLTSAFDTECSKLRDTMDIEGHAADASIAGSSNIDLHNPSTMPVTSTVQTPELFKGSLKEYQLKGLQWLVNCYEQGLNGILADEMGLGKTIQAMAFLAHLAEEKNIWGPFLVVAPASVLNNWADEISRFCPDLKTLPYWGGLQERMVLRKNINPKRLYRRDAGFHILITSYQLLVSDEKYFRRVKWQYMVLDEAQAIKSSNRIENHAEHGGTLNEHQLNRLHAILKPFMLRRVKKDVISELTRKTEVTVHCKLSSRQQAFYQAIKNKISLAELFDGSRGHLNEKKIMNLMNIVIQLRKVCNHPELFERNEGSTYLYFGEIPNSLSPPPFGELEDIHYSGCQNPITYKIPKLVHNEIVHSSEVLCSAIGHGVGRESFLKYFNIFSPENVYRSMLGLDYWSDNLLVRSGEFGFTHLMDFSPGEVAFLATGSFMERLLFSIMRSDRQYLDTITDLLMEDINDSLHGSHLGREEVRAVTRMLLMPSRSQTHMLRRKLGTGPADDPFEALVISHHDRLQSNIKLLHSTYTFIPRTRAPPICAHSSDRNFAYKMTEELHQPWIKRLFVGFARTSDFNGPRKPAAPHPLVQEIDSDLSVSQPALELTYKIFGSCPPMQSFDPAKLLTDSGKLQTLDILLKRLRAENHRVLLFAQMTKMLNILEDYMNYRKYRYLRLDGSSTIMDRRDMVRDFQLRNDIFVFLLSTRAGGLGINLTAADTVIFYESDWNPTLDLQAMDRAHRLGQTKDVTVYRLICKETVEEKILLRASQKNTVQQLVMTGGHVQDDLLAPEDVVSLLLDDAQLEQKLREVPVQAKDRQKKKPTKAIRLDAEGDATLEDLTETVPQGTTNEASQDAEKSNSNNKKRKPASEKQTSARARNSQKTIELNSTSMDYELDDPFPNTDPQSQRPKRPKRPKKSVNENLEPAFTAATPQVDSTQYPHMQEFGSGSAHPNSRS